MKDRMLNKLRLINNDKSSQIFLHGRLYDLFLDLMEKIQYVGSLIVRINVIYGVWI